MRAGNGRVARDIVFRSRGENLRFIYVLLFLSVAFFFLEYQDGEKYARLFAFDSDSVASGEIWRVVTFQFTQAGRGWFAFPKPVVLFFTLILLYLMGSTLEEEWGTRHFVVFFLLSTLGSALVASVLHVPLLGAYFVNFTLLFGYSATFPQQTLLLFWVVPVRVRWLAYVALGVLIAGVFAGGRSNMAALAGAVVAMMYYVTQRVRIVVVEKEKPAPPARGDYELGDGTAIRNAARFVGIKRAVAGKAGDIEKLHAQCEREVVPGVNICPPADYKPEHTDGYCIRCEGFAECSARYLSAYRTTAAAPAKEPIPEGT
jgi:membrane associated rhomboid family serine protease